MNVFENVPKCVKYIYYHSAKWYTFGLPSHFMLEVPTYHNVYYANSQNTTYLKVFKCIKSPPANVCEGIVVNFRHQKHSAIKNKFLTESCTACLHMSIVQDGKVEQAAVDSQTQMSFQYNVSPLPFPFTINKFISDAD